MSVISGMLFFGFNVCLGFWKVKLFRADGGISEFCLKLDINILGSANVSANIPRAIVNEMFNRMPELGGKVKECVNTVRGLPWKVCVKLISRCYR